VQRGGVTDSVAARTGVGHASLGMDTVDVGLRNVGSINIACARVGAGIGTAGTRGITFCVRNLTIVVV